MKTRIPIWISLVAVFVVSLQLSAASSTAMHGVEDSLRLAQELMQKVDSLYDQGQYAAAIPVAQQALEIRERVLGPEHPDSATALNRLGRMHRYAGDYKTARRLLERALEIREKVLGPDHVDTADTLNNLGAVHHLLFHLKEAEQLYLRALAIREEKLDARHADLVVSRTNLGLLEASKGNLASAESYLKVAITNIDNCFGNECKSIAAAMNALGGLYARRYPGKAEPFLLRAVKIDEALFGRKHPEFAASLVSLGKLYDTTGRHSEAEKAILEAISVYQSALGPRHLYSSRAKFNLALVYKHSGAYASAEELLREQIKTLSESVGIAHPDYAMALNSLGDIYSITGDYKRAVPLLKNSVAIYESTIGLDTMNAALSMGSLANCYLAMGKYTEALDLQTRVLDVKMKLSGHDDSQLAESFHDLAVLHSHVSDDRAQSEFQRAISIRERYLGPNHADLAQSLSAYAMLKWKKKELNSASALFSHAQAIQSKNFSQFLSDGTESRSQSFIDIFKNDVFKFVSFSTLVSNRQSVALGLTSVLQFKGLVLDSVSDIQSSLRRTLDAEGKNLLQQRVNLASEISTLAYKVPDSESASNNRMRISALLAKQADIDMQLSNRSSEYRRQITPVTITDVAHELPTDSALVEFFRYTRTDPNSIFSQPASGPANRARYVAYVLKHEGDPAAVDLGDASVIDSLASEFRQGTSDPIKSNGGDVPSDLSDRLFIPLSKHLHGVSHLIVSPDGALNLVPIAAMTDEKGRLLAERFEISYVTSGRDLLRNEERSPVHGHPVVVANPNFGKPKLDVVRDDSPLQAQRSADLDRSGLIFRPLENTALEATEIASMLRIDTSQILRRDDATERKIKQIHGPAILHIATHGFFLSDQDILSDSTRHGDQYLQLRDVDNPLLRSGLALTGANSRQSGINEDGILTALEASQLDLTGTELVVLSACDSGVGEVQNGEGVYGLRRALMIAGAQSQVTSLWKVSDEATRKLMVEFYRRLVKGEGRSEALRHAQLAMLADPAYSHPYYWASFISIGNWTPIKSLH